MDNNIKILVAAIVVFVVVCIVALIALYAWNIFMVRSYGTAGNSGSLGFQYSGENGSQLNPTQHSPDGSFKGSLYVEGTADTMLMAMVDYNVTAFSFNGSINETHMIPTRAYINETGYVLPFDPVRLKETFNVSGMSEGFHDVALLGFVDPYNYSGSDWRYDGPSAQGALRFNVIVNNSSKSWPGPTDNLSSGDTLYFNSSEFPSASETLSKEPHTPKVWQRESVKSNDTVDYYVNLAHPWFNNNQTSYNFSIVQLLDYKQIPIRAGTDDMVYYGHIDKEMFESAHMSLQAPNVPGDHKLIVIVSGDPYADLEVAPYVEDNQTWTTNKNASSFTDFEHQDIIVS